MAFGTLNLRGKIWNNAGLKYLVLPRGMTAGQLSQPQAANKTPLNLTGARSKKLADNDIAKNVRPIPPSFKNSSFNNSRSDRVQEGISTPKNPDIIPPKAEKKWSLVPLESWPPVWRDIYAKTKKGKIAWTYWDLGRDLLFGNNSPNPEENARCKKRGQLLRKLFKDINTQGENVLWPVCVPENSQSQNNTINLDIYWSGLRYLGCRAVVLMGSFVAWPILEQKNLKPFTAITKNGYHIWILRDIEALVVNEDFYASSLRLLKSLNIS